MKKLYIKPAMKSHVIQSRLMGSSIELDKSKSVSSFDKLLSRDAKDWDDDDDE